MEGTEHRPSGIRRLLAVLAVSATLMAGLAAPASAAAERHHRPWFTSWAQSQQRLSDTVLRNQSVRMVTHLSQGGRALRVRIQNTFGTTPLTVDAATVARSDNGPALVGRAHDVTFDGRRAVVVPAGGEVWSDPVRLVTEAQDDVAVSMFVAGEARPGEHVSAFRRNYLTPAGAGDHTSDPSGAAYTRTVESTYLVSAVDVADPRLRGTLVAYGSSVVDGTGSTNCGPGCTELGTNRRWTDELARRITAELPRHGRFTVANAGIGGTTSSAECSSTPDDVDGLDAVSRLERDVLALHGVTGVLYYYGTNDLAHDCTAEQIVDSYRDVFARLHREGIDVYVTPITPRPGYTDQQNVHRHGVGGFVRHGGDCTGTCDGVLDFDQVLMDPVRPNSIYPPYDTGDGIHANIAGQQAIADYVSLPMITG
ncbi:GDSL-type esterase/lipase family protein [Actinophytocola gossypii]|uniref:SGNH hydrolase n=1 Tax=Actinophytocola gossypii TaxID=2812003 RepID=A0ABT2J2H6_9PSEU|nr:GDSL-type esterase/lipase family protein [Actinophytocola gossypii]MCT2581876.1 SGNH hydrolase [Actinophytocola gossypii]